MDQAENNVERDRDAENVYTLVHPLDWPTGRIERLELKPSGRHMRNFKLKIGADESFEFEPYVCAELGLKLAGQPSAMVDKMHPADITGLGVVVFGFILPGQKTGSGASQ